MEKIKTTVKKAGFPSVFAFAAHIGETPTNIYRWEKTRPRRLELLLAGAAWERAAIQQLEERNV